MDTAEIVDLSSDDEGGEAGSRALHFDSDIASGAKQQNVTNRGHTPKHYRSRSHSNIQNSEENMSPSRPNSCHSCSGDLKQGLLPVGDDAGLSDSSPICAALPCRHFWKAGNYDNGLVPKVRVSNAGNYLNVHPLFLHSNATSHKWAFGAIAELLDNAVDEIQNGATYVIVDRISNPKDKSPALLIQDDGGGMDPEAMRRCMSFGFSDKSKFAIGQCMDYGNIFVVILLFSSLFIFQFGHTDGNGFKTGTMRLGADVIVFSRHLNNGILTQSIGLLSYTYMMQTQLDRIVVPMVHYQINTSSGSFGILNDQEHFISNLSIMLRWSPFTSEIELLKQLDEIGCHGTKIIIYNLWFNDDGNLELDFDFDTEDICIAGDIKEEVDALSSWETLNEQHTANRLRYSLRVYLSILYLRLPESFTIILRGQVVDLHNIADDLQYPEFILYKPHSSDESAVVTTIGFVKEAPEVNVHGFNIYHKNRLILPYWQVVSYLRSRGRGVVGVLKADFIQPTHNKQDFERTSLFAKLEHRLKEMTWEYWDSHCQLLGYQKKRPKSQVPIDTLPPKPPGFEIPVALNKSTYPHSTFEQVSPTKRKERHGSMDLHKMKKQTREQDFSTSVGCNDENIQTTACSEDQEEDQGTIHLIQVNTELHARCLEFEKTNEELCHKVTELRSKIQDAKIEYNSLLSQVHYQDLMLTCIIDGTPLAG
ncbi:protein MICRORCHIDIA 6 isoform X1 [Arachis ipaensis]|uniref:protein MICRORCHIDIA 6 isoform X1 n=1 Tax=Arachis ipaensis TaxID=130454 RepID=UPI0007AF68E4|nr:protein MICRORCHIDIA 6 isoform X1 [Arachis ipaensis]XP_016191245.1 protein MICRORCHIDIA 6 isoform X1 [Arachis ipaensis]XP_020978347.1 protein MICRORCHIDIA 6 isoform X1 [Arachis ipaensis]XP_025629108.1 protein MICRORCHIDIA 6 isoform X1 [Arachis hypogaea]XP_025629110.1 protein MICRORCHIDIA 6 isoform X1 [Arachis hypogaea]XP_025629111.1 protein MICRORCHIDIA 6 isoform X1 [Arachis hypogaea]QHO20431.1 MORC family CW-type zinc finger protein [Arachis hypogaea]